MFNILVALDKGSEDEYCSRDGRVSSPVASGQPW